MDSIFNVIFLTVLKVIQNFFPESERESIKDSICNIESNINNPNFRINADELIKTLSSLPCIEDEFKVNTLKDLISLLKGEKDERLKRRISLEALHLYALETKNEELKLEVERVKLENLLISQDPKINNHLYISCLLYSAFSDGNILLRIFRVLQALNDKTPDQMIVCNLLQRMNIEGNDNSIVIDRIVDIIVDIKMATTECDKLQNELRRLATEFIRSIPEIPKTACDSGLSPSLSSLINGVIDIFNVVSGVVKHEVSEIINKKQEVIEPCSVISNECVSAESIQSDKTKHLNQEHLKEWCDFSLIKENELERKVEENFEELKEERIRLEENFSDLKEDQKDIEENLLNIKAKELKIKKDFEELERIRHNTEKLKHKNERRKNDDNLDEYERERLRRFEETRRRAIEKNSSLSRSKRVEDILSKHSSSHH